MASRNISLPSHPPGGSLCVAESPSRHVYNPRVFVRTRERTRVQTIPRVHTTPRYLLIWVVDVLLTHVSSFPRALTSQIGEGTPGVESEDIDQTSLPSFRLSVPKRAYQQLFSLTLDG